MAVQAQYPSNVLLLNNRNGQEGYDYSLQPQPGGATGGGGGILDQSHMLFNNGGSTNSRKRARESTTPRAISQAPAPNVLNSFSLQSQSQPQPPQLIHLSHLHHHQQQNGVSTGLRLSSSFADHHHQQQQQQDASHSSAFASSLLSRDFASQIKQQRDEIHQFLQAQEEQLRRTLTEKRQRHYRALISAAEETVARRLREKEMEVEKATRRNAELEARAAQLSAEAQVWQAKAKAQEATAASLQAQLQQAMMSGGGGGMGTAEEVGLSCAEGGAGQAEDAESAYVDPERVGSGGGPKCRGCGKRVASVVVLPCRHLCMCTKCDAHFRACPVCLNLKNSTVEVYLS
ncbi:BOI-related E3 ubiquitin-protein ligase 1-like isoform X2 [Senna tora]|uniref:BOI-related E3 ubiquitin-protein ligase 1-like isoform X2 n=1 Tax=Senna tora TaxID=362788 RepID=A0A834SY11_9FABA|nr:BOI-related E3 ubiquitin-protein ligase 1-like isoform X2 [Senna tora]